jgi:hypothetical protein
VKLARLAGVFVVALGCLASATACGGAGHDAATPPASKPRDAAELAVGLVGGKVGVLVYAERVRGTPLAPKLAALELWRPILEGTGIDPQRDVDRAFATAPTATGGERVLVAQHSLPEERVRAAVDVLVGKSRPTGAWLDDLGVPAALVTVQGERVVVALATPSLLVVLPEARAKDAARFAGSGGFPDPEGAEAAVATAIDPARTLRAPHVPPIPPTIGAGRAVVTVAKDGGADVALDAADVSPAQAGTDADALTRAVDDATTVRVAILSIRLMQPVRFRAEGDHVKADVHFAPSDLDRLLGLASALR